MKNKNVFYSTNSNEEGCDRRGYLYDQILLSVG